MRIFHVDNNVVCFRVITRYSRTRIVLMFAVSMLLTVVSECASGQELTPRAYWPAPYGTQFLSLGYAYSTGDVVTDPSLPLVGVDSQIRRTVIAYQQTISVAGRTSNVQIELPYVDGYTAGIFMGEPADRSVSGIGDFSATWSVNLMGAPSMTREEFQVFRQNPDPILAASIKVVTPTGEYDTEKLINVGTNRWAAKVKLAYLHPMPGKWVLETAAGVWFFQDDDEFLGQTREQEPITALDLSVVKRFKPGFWGSIDANYYLGGRTIVGGDKKADFQRNSRLGVSLGYPLNRRHAIKASYSAGVVTESGGNYNTIILNYLYRIQ